MLIKYSGETAYSQVKKDIEYKITHDVYKVGDKLPTNVQLCDIYDVSRITINRALAELESEGYIEKHQGKGCYVKFKEISQDMSNFYSFTDELKKMNMEPGSIFVSLKLMKPDNEISAALDIRNDEMVYRLKRLRLANGAVVAFDRSYIPEKYIPNFKKEMLNENNGSLYETLTNNYGFRPNHSEETIEAIIIDDYAAEIMNMEAKSPALLVKRVSYYNDKKIEFNFRIVNSKVFKYKMSLR